jgi:hypothetical protein
LPIPESKTTFGARRTESRGADAGFAVRFALSASFRHDTGLPMQCDLAPIGQRHGQIDGQSFCIFRSNADRNGIGGNLEFFYLFLHMR